MIFFEDNNSKLFILVVMAVLTSVFIFYKYLELNPIPEIANNDQNLIAQISDGTEDNLNEIKNNFEVGLENVKDIGAELKKENDRQALFEQAKEYAEEKLASSTATSTATSSPKEN